MSEQQLLTEECIENGRDRESKISIPKNEPSVENLESEFHIKNELIENGICGETTILPLQNESVKMSGLISKIEPKVEPFESKFLVQNELVEDVTGGETMILPPKYESVIVSSFPNLKVENQENIGHSNPMSFNEKSEQFEIISDKYCLVTSIKKEPSDIEIQTGFATQDKMIQSLSHEALETDPLAVKPKIEPIFGTEVFQYEGQCDKGTHNTPTNITPDEQLDVLDATDKIGLGVNASALKGCIQYNACRSCMCAPSSTF